MADRPPNLHDRKAPLQQLISFVRQKIAHALRAGPFGVVVMHARHDFADLERFAHRIVPGAQRMIENDDARRAALGLHQRFHLRIIDAAHLGLVEEIGDLGVVAHEAEALALEVEVVGAQDGRCG